MNKNPLLRARRNRLVELGIVKRICGGRMPHSTPSHARILESRRIVLGHRYAHEMEMCDYEMGIGN